MEEAWKSLKTRKVKATTSTTWNKIQLEALTSYFCLYVQDISWD